MTGSGASSSGSLPRVFLVAVFTVNLLAFLNFVGVFVAMVAIATSFDVPASLTLQLPVALYVAVACAAPTTPWLMARLGVRRLLVASIAGLAATTAAAAAVDSFWPLLGVLFLHGLFCAPISPATQAAISDRLEQKDLGIGMAVWGAGNYACYLVGPLLIGWLVTTFGWRSFLLLPLPFVLLAIPLVLATMPRRPVEPARGDTASLMLAPLTLFFLLAATSLGPSLGWFASPLVIGAFAGCGALAVLFARAYRRTPEPRFDLSHLRDPFAGTALLVVLVYNLVSTGLFQVDFLGEELHESAEFLGLRSAVAGVAMLAGFLIAAWLGRLQQTATMLLSGFALTLCGKAGYLLYGEAMDMTGVLWPVVVASVGFSLVTGALATLAYRNMTGAMAAQVATAFILAIYLGASLGEGILEQVYQTADGLLLAAGDGEAASRLHAFHVEFWVELVVTVLLLVPAARLLRLDAAWRRAMPQPT